MSESEEMGRCRSEVDMSGLGSSVTRAIADAIDRLAADVAAVKEAVCDGSVAEERDRFFAGWAAALNERDKLRAEVETAREQRGIAVMQRDAAITRRDDAEAEVERLKAIVHSDNGHMAKILIENERLRAERAAPQPAAPPPGWLTEEEKRCLPEVLDDLRRWGYAKSAEVIEAILSRACSPPVVEVPAMSPATYGFDSPFSSGEYRAGYRQACLTHRAAMDRAGVKWKEV